MYEDPLDFFAVRHGESQWNWARKRAREGDERMVDMLRRRHSSSVRLTALGETQAIQTGAWIRNHFGTFDEYLTSEFIRALETATLLDLPGAQWDATALLCERDWGLLDTCSTSERHDRYASELNRRNIDPFFWQAPGGEHTKSLYLSIRALRHELRVRASRGSVIAVCHEEVMLMLRVVIERISHNLYKDLTFAKDPRKKIANCDILHYTCRDPKSGTLYPEFGWVRHVRPSETPASIGPWRKIKRPRYSNTQLRTMVDSVERINI